MFYALNRRQTTTTACKPIRIAPVTIERCLDNLKKLRYKKIEIIVSDDKSKDSCKRLVQKYIKNNPKQNIILVGKRKNGGRGAAINLGLKHANGEIVIAFDADCEFEKTCNT